jgi:hypothetical protein
MNDEDDCLVVAATFDAKTGDSATRCMAIIYMCVCNAKKRFEDAPAVS